MSAKTKIVVLHRKEVILAAILAAVGLFFLLLLLFWIWPDRSSSDMQETTGREATDPPKTRPSPAPADGRLPASAKAGTSILEAGILQDELPAGTYIPGVYKTQLILGGQTVEVEAILEEDRISSLRLVNLDEAVTTMYPLLQPTMDQICSQVILTQSLENLETDPGAKYTSLVLLEAIRCCLDKAADK